MAFYHDMVLCAYHVDCARGQTCPKAFTEYHQVKAEEGKLPVSTYSEKPECYIEKQ